MTFPPSLTTFHTAISLVAVFAGLISLLWHKEITARSAWGRIYIFATIITCLTGFGIYNQGGFEIPQFGTDWALPKIGIAHILGLMTLIMLRIGTAAGEQQFGSASPYIEPIAFSATFFFHMIPAITEGATRFPVGAPLVPSRESPVLLTAIGVCFGLYLIGAILQVLRVRRQQPKPGVKLQSLTVPRV